jgi:hypothetical protein
MIARINNAQNRVLTNVLNDGRMNRLLEQEALNRQGAYPLSAMLDDVRRGIWAEIYTASPSADAFRRELQSDFLTTIGMKVNVPPRPPPGTGPVQPFGAPQFPVLSDDARSHLRGELLTLRSEIQRAIPRTSDRSTRLHLMAAVHRIDEILDPNN